MESRTAPGGRPGLGSKSLSSIAEANPRLSISDSRGRRFRNLPPLRCGRRPNRIRECSRRPCTRRIRIVSFLGSPSSPTSVPSPTQPGQKLRDAWRVRVLIPTRVGTRHEFTDRSSRRRILIRPAFVEHPGMDDLPGTSPPAPTVCVVPGIAPAS